MSQAERAYKAKRKQGKMTPEMRDRLRQSCLMLLEGRWQTTKDIQWGLVRNCGWPRDFVFGPVLYVENVLEQLESDGQAESRSEGIGTFPVGCVITEWRKAFPASQTAVVQPDVVQPDKEAMPEWLSEWLNNGAAKEKS